MSKSINIESNSMIGEYRTKVLSEIERLDKNLINLSGLYGFEASCLSAWKQTFSDTLWSIFSAMLPVKLREKECLLIQPCVLLSDQRCSFLPGESFIHPASAIRVNTVSPLYRRSRASSLKKRWGKYVPFLRLSGEWLLDYGFEIGKKYETYAKKNQLILKIGGCSGSGGGISSDNENTDRNRNVPDGDGIGGKNG
jgi:hypothetical protein